MGKTGRWLRNILTTKKEKVKEREIDQISGTDHRPSSPISSTTTPKEKRRWSFRRSSASAPPKHHDPIPIENEPAPPTDHKAEEEARKALNALRGLVKLQALVRGHLVRKQGTATLRCMQALVAVKTRARAQRQKMAAQDSQFLDQTNYTHRKSTHENMFKNSNYQVRFRAGREREDRGDGSRRLQARNKSPKQSKQDHHESDITSSLGTAESSPLQCYSAVLSKAEEARLPFSYPRSEYAESLCNDCPGYMANTQSSMAKVRSHSVPRQRPPEGALCWRAGGPP
ncbi:hypothetical protein SASPL_154848 [Salvia splendens]|uniref:DUF4005 domain-containing protein n=1 Tax=Salvia splendens TaxID=180675 RepID=A0A8X8W0N4_SALSN|nr:hypothetical protein SASPL_154848 [Salvia splendens]